MADSRITSDAARSALYEHIMHRRQPQTDNTLAEAEMRQGLPQLQEVHMRVPTGITPEDFKDFAARHAERLRANAEARRGQPVTKENIVPLVPQDNRHHHEDPTAKAFFSHSSAKRINTDVVITASLAKQYPALEIVVTPAASCNLLQYARAGNASFEPIQDQGSDLPDSLQWDFYVPPARRLDGALGGLAERSLFGKYMYKWKEADFIVYFFDGRDGAQPYPINTNYYILTSDKAKAQQLILEAGRWNSELREEVWVFDGGYWQKSKDLYDSIKNASWENVILHPEMKKSLIEDHMSFYNSRDTYARLSVPWKRGIIYYGPPGNGKTISVKAMMNMLFKHKPVSIPTLYVRSLASVRHIALFAGPENSIKQVFAKARQYAPCYLVFEDLDSIITDAVRSYFLNEVDGLKSNDGIFMVGSTNHLDRLDPGIAKRPSRFDRKYLFPNPNLEERVAYGHFWQGKLKDNKEIEFPDKLCRAIAEITEDFSFAYMQEAFVAALLAIARGSREEEHVPCHEGQMEDLGEGWIGVDTNDDADDDLNEFVLWIEIKKQIKILRDSMKEKATSEAM